jgi:hypothetical protein
LKEEKELLDNEMAPFHQNEGIKKQIEILNNSINISAKAK